MQEEQEIIYKILFKIETAIYITNQVVTLYASFKEKLDKKNFGAIEKLTFFWL